MARPAVIDNDVGMGQLISDLEFVDSNVIDTGIISEPDESPLFNADTVMLNDEAKQNEKRLTAGQVGSIHEFGIGIKERSFVRSTFDNQTLKLEKMIEREARKMVDGKQDGAKASREIGFHASREIRDTIILKRVPDISERRKEKKRSIGNPETALINWGIMLGSINWKVHRG